MISILKPLLPRSVKKQIHKHYLLPRKIKSTPKIFGIGNNKTGTTSLKVAMKELGFVIGHQRTAEKMVQEWAQRDFKNLIEYCKTAQFFQDVPFSRAYTYVVLDHHFPNSKFILTVRDNSEQWYNSITKFHAKLWGKEGRIPTKEDLLLAPYISQGWAWKSRKYWIDVPDDDPYNKKMLIETYENHNAAVIEYFRYRPQDLLVLNVSEKGAYQKLCKFLNVKSNKTDFPWENKTSEKK